MPASETKAETEFITYAEAAALVGMKQRSFYDHVPEWRAKGLRIYKPGRKPLVIKPDFLDFVTKHCQE
jgi:DNA modification methylase